MPAHWTQQNGSPRHKLRDYAQTPLNVYWEMTQACALACRHCRAEAVATPHPEELTFEEGTAFLRQIPEFGAPLPQLILTGGDPLARGDLYELIDEARSLGIGVSITPAATPALTRDVLARLKQHGVEGLGLSLDGSSAERHDSIRGVAGTFDRTIQAMRWAQELGMPLQVNTLVSDETAPDIPAIYELLKPLGVARWSLFFLISVGRGKVLATANARTRRAIDGLDLRNVQGCPIRCRHHGGAVLSTRCIGQDARGRAHRRADQKKHGLPWLWNPRWKWHRICIAHRRHLSGRFSAADGRQRSPGSPRRRLPQCSGVSGAARSRTVSRALRSLRVSRAVWRIARQGVRSHRRSVGRGSLLHLPQLPTHSAELPPARWRWRLWPGTASRSSSRRWRRRRSRWRPPSAG